MKLQLTEQAKVQVDDKVICLSVPEDTECRHGLKVGEIYTISEVLPKHVQLAELEGYSYMLRRFRKFYRNEVEEIMSKMGYKIKY